MVCTYECMHGVCIYMCACMMCLYMSSMCKNQRTTFLSWFSPSTFAKVLEIKLRSSPSDTSTVYPLSHVTNFKLKYSFKHSFQNSQILKIVVFFYICPSLF